MKVGDTLKFKKAIAAQISSQFKQHRANVLLVSDLAILNKELISNAWEIIREYYPESKNFELTWNPQTDECVVLKKKQAY
jgi:hypothetical protein